MWERGSTNPPPPLEYHKWLYVSQGLDRQVRTPVADTEGVQWVHLNPLHASRFLISYEDEIIGLHETKLFHFHGIFMKNEIKLAKRTPTPLFIL